MDMYRIEVLVECQDLDGIKRMYNINSIITAAEELVLTMGQVLDYYPKTELCCYQITDMELPDKYPSFIPRYH